MVRQGFVTLLLLGSLGIALPCSADIDPSEYEKKKADALAPMSVEEQRRARAAADPFDVEQMNMLRTAEELQAESERKQREAEAEARRIAAEKAAYQALPLPQRLTIERCTACHVAERYTDKRHNRIGWELVTLRMDYLNKGKFGPGERSMITAYLAETYPATGAEAFSEWLAQLLVLLGPLGAWLVFRGVRGAIFRRRVGG